MAQYGELLLWNSFRVEWGYSIVSRVSISTYHFDNTFFELNWLKKKQISKAPTKYYEVLAAHKDRPYHAACKISNLYVAVLQCCFLKWPIHPSFNRCVGYWSGDDPIKKMISWWRHQMETFSALLLAICAGNSPVTGEFPAQRPVSRSLDVFF